MNLYKLHSDPESLKYHDIAHDCIPLLVWDKYKNNPSELKKREDTIAKSTIYSYWYARDILKGPFPKGEDAIAATSYCSYNYAAHVLKKRFFKGEDAISENPVYAYHYAYFIIEGPFPKGEDTIMQSECANEYKKLLNRKLK